MNIKTIQTGEMMIIADLHTHTKLCNHASGMPIDYVKAAIAKSYIDILGIADHFPFSAGFDLESRMQEDQWDFYVEQVLSTQDFASENGLEVLLGTELDYVEKGFDKVKKAVLEHTSKVDYIIGSVHCANGIAFDNPIFLEEWKSDEFCDKIYESYGLNLVKFIKSGLFHIIGHIDLPKKFNFFPSTEHKKRQFLDVLDYVFELASEQGVAFEMNSAGKYKPVTEFYPNIDILRLAAKHDMLVTFGSDAHLPNDVGNDFAEMRELALYAGLKKTVFFRKKQPIIQKII